MKKYSLAFLLICFLINVEAQDIGFPFGSTYKDLAFTPIPRDSSADAIVLQEFGEAYIESGGNNNLIFEYHTKIKILKKAGLKFADIEIPLYKGESDEERIHKIQASSFTLENGSMKETPLDQKNIFTENKNTRWTIKKFAIPNVQVGSVIEFIYTLESPFIFKFRNWEFQSEIPKVSSEYWARIPANYTYNVTLAGYLKLSKNEGSLIKDCFTPGGYKADCSLMKYGMKNIPAFTEEDYMTARSNHVSAINFELSEIRYFSGSVNRITKEWKDADDELRKHQNFGVQLKRGKDIGEDHLKIALAGETDPLEKAKKVYNFIRDWYSWNGTPGMFSDTGVKKSFEKKTGNVGDINLTLIAALRYAGFNVEPVILSTRENGLPIEIHPVITDFNYVVAKVNIGDKSWLADATDDFVPFGVLPIRCINGKGRVLGEKESSWIELKPSDRAKKYSVINLKLHDDGMMRGSVETTYMGYDAISKRKELYSFNDTTAYIKDLDEKIGSVEIRNSALSNVSDVEKSLIQKLKVEAEVFQKPAQNFLLNPLFMEGWKENPFKSQERLYPVDFGAPIESTVIVNMEYPKDFEVVDLPDRIGLTLPNSGGRFMYEVQNVENKIVLSATLSINKSVYTANEYHYLKELFSRMIQAYQQDLLFKKKT